MKVVRARYAFAVEEPPLIDCHELDLNWSGPATLSGASGIGKTTFFRLLSGWFPPAINAQCVYEDSIDPFRDIYFVGAHRSLLPWKTVDANIRMHSAPDVEVASLLDEVGLECDIASSLPYELSAGMYKRVELVIGVLRDPVLLLLDEFYSSIADVQKPLVGAFLRRARPLRMTWAIAHEDQLRRWIGGPEFRFVVNGRTIVGVTT